MGKDMVVKEEQVTRDDKIKKAELWLVVLSVSEAIRGYKMVRHNSNIIMKNKDTWSKDKLQNALKISCLTLEEAEEYEGDEKKIEFDQLFRRRFRMSINLLGKFEKIFLKGSDNLPGCENAGGVCTMADAEGKEQVRDFWTKKEPFKTFKDEDPFDLVSVKPVSSSATVKAVFSKLASKN